MKNMRRDVRRRLDQFVANSQCEANVRSAVHDIPMLEIARQEGFEPSLGQSPFAIIRGQIFERSLYADEAAVLRRELVKRRVLPASAQGFVDLRIKRNGGPKANLVEARDSFYSLLESFAEATDSQRGQLPSIIASPTLQIPGRSILPDGLFAMDVLTVHPASQPEAITLQIGEIKVYPDRGGFTDRAELAQTRAQAGVYLYGLRLVIEKLGLSQSLKVLDQGFLVFTYPGTNLPSVRAAEDLRWQAERAQLSFDRLREAAARELPIDPGPDSDLPKARKDYILEASTQYNESCWQFCERAESCFQKASRCGDPIVLGESVARLLGSINLQRAIELIDGVKAENDAELDFLERVRALSAPMEDAA